MNDCLPLSNGSCGDVLRPKNDVRTIMLSDPKWHDQRHAITCRHTLTFKNELHVQLDSFLENGAIIPMCCCYRLEDIDDNKKLKGTRNMHNVCGLSKARCKTRATRVDTKRCIKDVVSLNSRLSGPRAPKNRGRPTKSTIPTEESSVSEDDMSVPPLQVSSTSYIDNASMPHLDITRVSSISSSVTNDMTDSDNPSNTIVTHSVRNHITSIYMGIINQFIVHYDLEFVRSPATGDFFLIT